MQSGVRILTNEDLNNITTSQQELLGAVGATADGRRFIYAKVGGTSTVNPGLLLVAPAAPSNSTGLAIPSTQPNTGTSLSALAAGSTSFNVTNGSTAVTANEFDFVEVIVSAGGSYKLRLAGNTAASASGTITLTLDDPIPQGATTLIAGTDTVNLRYGPWNGPTASTTAALPVGVTILPVPNTSSVTNYAWLQTWGPAYVAADSATKGQALVQGSSTAGAVKNSAASTTPQVAVAQESAASSLASVFLTLQ